MEFKSALGPLYKKLAIFTFIFLLLLGLYIFSLKFYSDRITQRVETFHTLKEEIAKSQVSTEEELKLRQLANLIQSKTGKDLNAILYDVQNKLERNFDTTKNLLLNKFAQSNWKVNSSNFDPEAGKLYFVLEIPQTDIESFLDFLIEEALILKIENFKIIKSATSTYQIEISFKLK